MSPYQRFLQDAAKRRKAVLEYAEKHGVRAAADKFGISTQRVGQMRKKDK